MASATSSPTGLEAFASTAHITDELSAFVSSYALRLWHNPTSVPIHNHYRRRYTHITPPFLASPPFAQAPQDFSVWVHRVLTSSKIPTSILFLALSLIHRLRTALSTAPAPGTEFIAFTTALMLAMKTPTGADNTYSNAGWETISKVPVHLLNAMEIHFVVALQFDLWVLEPDYLRWLRCVEGAAVEHRRTRSASLVDASRYHRVMPPPLDVPPARNITHPSYSNQYLSPPTSTQGSPSVSSYI
ncbi:hypothetical protein HK101_008825 [Irineochytrium annulatum]|nr:hypothetical protein HK101_008825 [Irineochytrium annulatum]